MKKGKEKCVGGLENKRMHSNVSWKKKCCQKKKKSKRVAAHAKGSEQYVVCSMTEPSVVRMFFDLR